MNHTQILYNEVPGYKKGDWKDYSRHTDKEIAGFFGEYRWLSNFHVSPTYYDGVIFPSVENAYQAAKFDKNIWSQFICCSPINSKKLGRSYKMKSSIEQWNNIKLSVMTECILAKFLDRDLRAKLIETENRYLEETNTWSDFFYGVCNGKGDNKLGKILMETRNLFKLIIEKIN